MVREEKLEPGRDIPIRPICAHLGSESQTNLAAAWGGAAVYDWHGVGDTGIIAGQGQDRGGMDIMEDAQALEVADPDTGLPVPEGTLGDMICTCLFKDDIFPIIRFNPHDVTEEALGPNPLGIPFRHIRGLLGRSDNMVKLNGINLLPTGIGVLLVEHATAATGEFGCRVIRLDGREAMAVHLKVRGPAEAAMQERLETLLRTQLGVEIGVSLCTPVSQAEVTQVESWPRPIRLVDDRR